MNHIYKVVWNHTLLAWTAVSEFGRGRTKCSTPTANSKSTRNAGLVVLALLVVSGNVYAYDVNGYTDFNSSTSISDGLQWNGTATVQVDLGANVTVSNASASSTLNMNPAGGGNTSLWMNGGTLTASNNGSLLMGTNSMLQIGGAQVGGLTSEQSGGFAGTLSIGELKTVSGATNATLWMFGSTSSTAKLYADSIDLEADNNVLFISNPSSSESGAEINVVNDMTVINKVGGTLLLVGNSQLNVGRNLYLDTTNGSFLLTNNDKSSGVNVGGDFTLTNNVQLSSDINSVSTAAGIYSTVVNVDGDINLIGKNVGSTGLQIINGAGTGITSLGDFNISSTVSGNTTDVIFGHGAKVTSYQNITLNSVAGGATNLYIGDSKYGAPTYISAKSIDMTGSGDNKVIFNNTINTPTGTGYLFDVAINGNGSVEQQSGHTTLSATSNFNGGTVISGGLLSIANSQALGSAGVAINTANNDDTKGLDIAYTDGSSFGNQLSGSGYTTVSGKARIVGSNQAYAGNWNITGTAMTDESVSSTLTNFGTGEIHIANNGTLIAQTAGAFDFVNQLVGDGTFIADNKNAEFNFTAGAGDQFAGDVVLKNNTFDLENINTTALTNATLHVGTGNATTVGIGTQNIGGLAFNGGKLIFGDVNPGDTTSDRYIETSKELDLTGSGQVQINDGAPFENLPQTPNTSLPLLQQDSAGVMVKLAGTSGTVTGDGGNLSFIDQNGNVISHQEISDITQNGETVAKGIYDYRLTSGDNADGLYVNYGLTEVELLAQGSNALTLNAEGNTGNAADLSAKVTGTGDLRIDTDTDVSLSNSENSYSGLTDVVAGTLKMGNNNVLGLTRLLNLRSGSGFNMNGYAQTLQNIQTEVGSLLDFSQGSLTVSNGIIAGDMTGAGDLTVAGGSVTVSGSGAGMTAKTTIASDGTIHMLSTDALGSGDVDNQGLLVLGEKATGTTPTGYQIGSLSNSGTVMIGHNDAAGKPVAGTTLTVNGNYAGDNGHLLFNTVLGNDSSVTDKLVVTGDTSGATFVSVTNAGGTGDSTLNGIELISVGGQSEGYFTQAGRIVAGAYDYSLVRGTGDNSGNWYLNSSLTPIDPIDPIDPPDDDHVNRPEAGSYIANIAAANTLFNTRLHDRLGETQYVDVLTGEKKVTSLWLRQVGSHNNWRDDSGQLKTQSNSYVAQLGGDVAQWTTDGLNRGHIGLMAGYGNNHNTTRSSVTDYNSKGSLNGYSVGAYGTWFANDADKAGVYVDSWLQYSWFNNQVNGQQLASESYKSKGLTASFEAGCTIKMGKLAGSQGTLNEWFIQPQAQAIWMGVKADNHREENGTRVSSDGDGNVQTRLGMRAYLKSHNAMDEGKGRTFEPFIEANWLHNTGTYSTTMDGDRISQAGARNIGEVKVGVEGQITSRVNLWGNIGTQVGDKGYSDSSAMVGFKYNF
ncbi:autotransporter outer membrane beta-barrel domain-containing protein [Aeromonas jandaei]|uniref:autotransporter outer membrane beta-barrel domain-containing protein n=1 Tax=Aeromonas jandaei TaxID=650 RepID=UPI001932FE97|nr:autotransporter outer membrane beta-barrel domain-containing protein [Aeromonas jandaei]MBM0493196.1 autotransporter outer membrane beta-barrel domain-containing protein [Aeromonas jandaei]MBM0570933.1 autotransporter outer membrane beta-barrel domain-containing protein [Aeromonas jandaei]